MNAPEAIHNELNTVDDSRANSLALITNEGNMQRLMALAEMMADSKVTVPKHLQGNKGDCMAIIIQATNWGMNPFACAQKTHLVNGTLGYEAQLVNAVVCASGAITGDGFTYEYKGEGASMECRVGATKRGKSEITWGEWLCIGLVTTRNSPLWKTNPKQQMGYLQIKNWARSHSPGAIMGVYTTDELVEVKEIDVTPPLQGAEGNKPETEKQKLPSCTPEKFSDMCIDVIDNDSGEVTKMGWKSLVESKSKTAEHLIHMLSTKLTLSEEQITTIKGWEAQNANG